MCTEFEPVLHVGQGQFGHKFADPSLVNKRVSDLGLNPAERTTQTAVPSLSPSDPSSLPAQLKAGEVDAHGAVALALLGRLPAIVEVAVLHWPLSDSGCALRRFTRQPCGTWYSASSVEIPPLYDYTP